MSKRIIFQSVFYNIKIALNQIVIENLDIDVVQIVTEYCIRRVGGCVSQSVSLTVFQSVSQSASQCTRQ